MKVAEVPQIPQMTSSERPVRPEGSRQSTIYPLFSRYTMMKLIPYSLGLNIMIIPLAVDRQNSTEEGDQPWQQHEIDIHLLSYTYKQERNEGLERGFFVSSFQVSRAHLTHTFLFANLFQCEPGNHTHSEAAAYSPSTAVLIFVILQSFLYISMMIKTKFTRGKLYLP